MNTEQLEKAKKEWGFAMDITLRNNRIYVANEGYITDDPSDITAVKHSGEFKGLYYQFRRKGTRNELIDVILAITREEKNGEYYERIIA